MVIESMIGRNYLMPQGNLQNLVIMHPRRSFYSTAVTILLIFLLVVYFYHHRKVEEIRNALYEHSLVVAEPMWNFDIQQMQTYLEAVADKYNYESLKITSHKGKEFFSTGTEKIGGLEEMLAEVGLIPLRQMETPVTYEHFDKKEQLGKIIVVWRDTSIYFITYAFVVSLLLIAIANLYSRIVQSKRTLEERYTLIEQQMAELKRQKEYIEDIFNLVPEGLLTFDPGYVCLEKNRSFIEIVKTWAATLRKDEDEMESIFLENLHRQVMKSNTGQYSMNVDGLTINIEFTASDVPSYESIEKVVSIRDVTKIATMERQLLQAQKLEAVGRLAAGIAHEINTPIQYVSSNIDFLMESYEEIIEFMSTVETFCAPEEPDPPSQNKRVLCQALEETDWEFLKEEIPSALEQSGEGVRRVAAIITAMKSFSHPSGEKAELNDINAALESTVTVARNEWKYVAELELNLDKNLPHIPCYLDQLNQVFLNIIVNSAHAIKEKYGNETGEKGKIEVTTHGEDDHLIVSIGDDGIGMSKGVSEKVFDPFFTTKELNKGTGQGLAIAYDVVVNRHKGAISVESEPDIGTTFTIALPLSNDS